VCGAIRDDFENVHIIVISRRLNRAYYVKRRSEQSAALISRPIRKTRISIKRERHSACDVNRPFWSLVLLLDALMP
jgi:hypothetical protein